MLLSGIHAGFMIIGFFILLAGFFTARFMKSKRWWLKTHRTLGVYGSSITILGFLAILFHLLFPGRPHFTQSHAYLGLAIVILAFVMPALGFIQLKIGKAAGKIRPMHRLFGWIMLMAMLINIVLGMLIADIL
jgi:heme A synthase